MVFLLISTSLFADKKDQIISQLNKINSLEFIFDQLVNEKLEFSLDKQMIEDFKDIKMMYAGVDHPEYNIKTREIPLVTVKSLASDF